MVAATGADSPSRWSVSRSDRRLAGACRAAANPGGEWGDHVSPEASEQGYGDLISAPLTAFSALAPSSLAVCGGAILLVMVACSVRFGGSGDMALGDVLLAGLSELIAPMILRSPLDILHVAGYALAQWSIALGTLLAIVGVILNHRAHQR